MWGAESQIKMVQKELGQLLDKEELWWRQRAKEEWLSSGDRNTRFFHACASARWHRNQVGMIKDKNGQSWENSDDVGEAFVKYFTTLFTRDRMGINNSASSPFLAM
jgi:hypothetical protein